MKSKVFFAVSLIAIIGIILIAQEPAKEQIMSIYDISIKDIDGKDVKLSDYKGKVLLIVNVASACGYTGQYKGMQEIYTQYQEKGLVVLGFPCNQFGAQEPGDEKQIKEFCSAKFHVTFPMFAKIEVKGPGKHPLYTFLTEKETNPVSAGEINWNFNKFLIDKNGKIVERFASKDAPESKKVVAAIEQALK